ncbi:MAG: hypothetical protein KF768_03170 [Phycisphaeraceae bacterium]|nr:hypothetical protein [Phycisphaeraceae bacterium]
MKHTRIRSLIFGAAAAHFVANSVSAQCVYNPPDQVCLATCNWGQLTKQSELSVEVNWSLTTSCDVDAIPSILVASASAYNLPLFDLCTITACSSGFLPACCGAPLVQYFCTDFALETGDALVQAIPDAIAEALPPIDYPGGNRAWALASTGGFSGTTASLVVTEIASGWNCNGGWAATDLRMGLAYSRLDQAWWFEEPCSDIDLLISFDLDLIGRVIYEPCDNEPTHPTPPGRVFPNTPGAVFLCITCKAFGPSNQIETIRSCGLAGATADLDIEPLGIFDSEEFTLDGDASNVRYFGSGVEVPFAFSLTDIERIEMSIESRTFHEFDGDFSNNPPPDRVVCYDDRAYIASLLGKSLNDEGYVPRADFDLNGEIDSDDYDAFHDIFAESACLSDFNCDGEVDIADLLDFLAVWNVQVSMTGVALEADINNDGVVDLADYLDFIADWNNRLGTACP